MKKNIKKEWTIPFNPKYSHPTKLSQTHYLLFIIFYELNPDIRSTEILTFLSIQYGITIEKSWVNQKLAQSGCQRPIGRPNKEYTKKKNHYITCLENTSEYVDAIGIHFLIAAIDALGFTNCIIEALLSCIKQSKTSKMPSNANSLRSFLHNLMQLILDRRISNFEEAIRCEMPLNLSMEHTRKLTKATEYLYNIDGALYHSFFDFWTNKLKSLNISQYQIYIDGHGSPLYTKDSAVCGRMSITGEIKPGTHHVICTDQHGFILCLYPESVDKHLNHGLEWVCVGLTTRLGDAVEIVVVDRECCGAEINQFVKEYCNINILTGLRKNQYNGWNDFDYNWLIENELAVGKWSDKAKQQIDSRTFLIYPQKEHLYVLATTSEDDSIHKRAFGLQKKRWPVNEGVIKLLVGEFDFNVNVGNGRNLIDNPKIEKIDEILYEKCTKYDNRIGKLKQKKLKNAKNLLINQSTQKKILDKKQTLINKASTQKSKLPVKVYQRNYKPQQLMSTLKAGIFNVILYLLMLSFETNDPLSIGVERIIDLLVNRSGQCHETAHICEYIFNPPVRNSDKNLLIEFFKGFNKLNLKALNGKRIVARLASGVT